MRPEWNDTSEFWPLLTPFILWSTFRQCWGSMRIRIRIFSLMRIRIWILLFIKVMRFCDCWSKDPPRLHFERLRLHCERPRPSMAPLWTSTAAAYWLGCGSAFEFVRILIRRPKLRNADLDPQLCLAVISNFSIYWPWWVETQCFILGFFHC